ncbi:MAG: O-antigen ligase family protein [Cyanobacteria bacterium J06600_6]
MVFNILVGVETEMMNLTESRQQTSTRFIILYQGFLAIAAILIFFTGIDIYLQNFTSLLPLHWMLAFLAASLPLGLSLTRRLDSLSKPVLFCALGYIVLSLLSILIQSTLPELQYLENQYRTLIFLGLMLVIFAYHPLVAKWTKLTVLGVTLVNALMYIYEFFNPLAYRLEQIAPGRSSGFYQDSNTAGISLILGMIFTIDLIKPKYRLFYALFIFLGLAPTFSRGAIVGWVMVVGILVFRKFVPRYQISLLLVFFTVAIIILSSQLKNLAYIKNADGDNLFQQDTLERVEFLINPFAQKDSSQKSRISHIEKAWKKFAERPFFGNGLGSGEDPSTISQTGIAQRSHNTYLDFMVEFGFLGAFIFPSILIACVYQAEGEFKKQGIAFALFLFSQGFFSHTLMSEFTSLTAYAIMSNLSRHSKQKDLNMKLKSASSDRLKYQN